MPDESKRKEPGKMKYGDKRDYPKIDIYVRGQYACSTTWAKTCREAKARYFEKGGVHTDDIKCRFDPRDQRRRARA